MAADSQPDYSTRAYWDERYKVSLQPDADPDRGALFDWLCTYQDLCRFLEQLPQAARVLDLGCGNSELAERLVTAHGLRAGSGSSIQVEAVDYSPLIVEHMAQHTEPLVSQCVLQYQVMDALCLGFRGSCFDVVIDKGCLDALLNAYDQEEWWRRCGARGECAYDGAASAHRAHQLVKEIARVLHPGHGKLVLVSYEPPKGRMHFLQVPEHNWRVTSSLDEETGNYVYVATRNTMH
mmetsp:Transcript_2275/g.4613  ORF Transcript_2275/g.4613 Transcript_2275/m.4613 type:complete len:236 (+) Transcript_2275:449-1156(+)|eukprot:CAMPEP_0114234552 /NCGR_PEP_ID=MMETSP0058-20121206/5769_1 /TAXON_ID=36894 /ORGANISM="Pyramimonas parkeae, CCMP726" /LENGTH=235 /DNA_ID=CAMNT_0001346237 /DNA_START=402 /DNA_END=1109 /DNA_ORIENTATION=+